MTDQNLLSQWVERREPELFRMIVERHAGMVFDACRRILRNDADAEDVAQECFEALMKVGLRPGAYLGAWLYRVAVNLSLRRLRSDARRKNRETQFLAADTPKPSGEWDDAYALVDDAIMALPERFRAPVVMHFLEGQTQEAIAESLGIGRTTVTYRIAHGLERIRQSLRKRGVTITAAALAALGAASSSEAIPAALTASLGRLAIAGSQAIPGAGIGMLTGWIGAKGVLATLVLLVAASVSYVATLHKPGDGSHGESAAPPISEGPQNPVPGRPAAGQDERAPASTDPAAVNTPPPAGEMVNVRGDVRIEGTGTPMPAVMVVLEDGATGKMRRDKTTLEGTFRFDGCAPGTYHARLEEIDFTLKDSPATVTIGPGDTTLHLVGDAGASITGRVYDKTTGKGAFHAGVYVAPIHGDGGSVAVSFDRKRMTDREGRFSIEGLRPGKYRVFLEPDLDVRDDAGNVLFHVTRAGAGMEKDLVVAGHGCFTQIDFPLLLNASHIAGIVRNSKGLPAAQARIRVSTGMETESANANDDGTFLVRGLPASDDCFLFVQCGGDACEPMGPLTLPEKGLDGLEVSLRAGATVRGTLVNPAGEPLTNCVLNARPIERRGLNTCAASTGTDDNIFTFEGMPAGRYEFSVTQHKSNLAAPLNACVIQEATPSGIGTTTTAMEVHWGETKEGITLVYGAARHDEDTGNLSITGKVVDNNGGPIAGATVIADLPNAGVAPFVTRQAYTDGDGCFRIAQLAKNTYSIRAEQRQYSSALVPNIEAGRSDMTITMQPAAAIEGSVVRADNGQPVTQFELTAPDNHAQQIADAQGSFTLSALDTSRSITVRIRAQGYTEWEQDFEMKPGERMTDYVVKLDQALGVRGRVLGPEGEPVAGARLFVKCGNDNLKLQDESAVAARSDANGTFTIPAIPALRGFVVASHTEYALGSCPFHPGATEVQIVLARGGAIEGIVTDAGKPAPEVNITAVRDSIRDATSLPIITTSDANGAFRMERLVPGEFQVLALCTKNGAPDGKIVVRRVTVEEGKVLTLTMALPETTAGIEGQVRAPRAGAPGGAVIFMSTEGGTETPYTAQIDGTGHYQFEHVPPGNGILRTGVASGPGLASRFVEVPVETIAGQVIQQDIDVADTGAIAVTVQNVPLSEHTLTSVSAFSGDVSHDIAARMNSLHALTATAASGFIKPGENGCRLELLAEGTYTLLVMADDLSARSTAPHMMAVSVVQVQEGNETAIDMVLEPASNEE